MHKKGAKLSLVHLFGLSKINRNYIQKGREIRRNMKRMKKVLSIVLSLAMILTSITVYNTKTAKAAGLFPFKYGQIDRGEFIVGANQINVVFSWDRNTYPVGQYTFKVYYENNQIISNDGAWEQARVPFGRDSYTFRVDVCDKENNNEVVATDTFDWTSPTNNDCGVVATVGKVASLSWKPISGAVRYAVLVDDSIIADNITDVSYECEVSTNVEHNITINAYNSDGEIIESTNNTAKVIIETRTEDTKTAIKQEPIELTGNEKWVAFDKKTKENNATVYIEEDTLNKVLTNSGLRGLYDKGSDGPDWNDVRKTIISDLPVFAFIQGSTNVSIVDKNGEGYEYTNITDKTNSEVWRGNDCIYINQNLIDAKPGEEKVFRITLTNTSFLIRVVGEKSEQYTATVDGEELAVTNNTVTLPTTADYGYYCKGKMYKKGSVVTLEENMAFTSVNKLDLTITNGVSIRLVTGETGLRYKATIVSDNNEAINSDAIQEGILITTQANYNDTDSNIEIGSDNVLNVANVSETNNKWYAEKNDTINNEYGGTFCGSIIKMIDSNIPRPFVARAYATIKYEGDSDATVIKYTDVIGKKSIKDIAKLIQEGSRYKENGYNADEMQIIDDFAKYTDAQ